MNTNHFKRSLPSFFLLLILVNLFSISFGISQGWASPTIILLMSDETNLPSGKITMEEGSWIVSLLYVGAMIGNASFGWITKKYGRKWPLLLLTVPIIVTVSYENTDSFRY